MAMIDQSHVIGIFRDRSLAEQAVSELRNAGFRDDQITMLGKGTHTSGGVLGGLRNLLSGQNEEEGDPAATLANLGLSPGEADYYRHELDAGHTLVAVRTPDRQQEATTILHHHGAYNATDSTTIPGEMGEENRTLRLRREDLVVDKQVVQSGEVRIHKRVVTENRTFTVPVSHEELVIEHISSTDRSPDQPSPVQTNDPSRVVERRAVTTQNTGSPTSQPQDEVLSNEGTIRILLHEDQITINRIPVIVEEVVIRKQLVEGIRELNEPVRHEEVHVVRQGNVIVHDNPIHNPAIDDEEVIVHHDGAVGEDVSQRPTA